MERPNDALKEFADAAARQISTGAGRTAARVLRMLHETQAAGAAPRAEAGPSAPGQVGIWKSTSIDGRNVFVRDDAAFHDWHLWANVGRIDAEPSGRRVLFLGESVARGLLYDPAYNPATVLQSILQARLGPGEVEVVDLARTSMGMEIREVAVAAAALNPDVVVIFCGNNWKYTHPTDPLGAGVVGAVIAERGVAGLMEHAGNVLRSQAERVVDDISACYAAAGVPVLWITPEYNLGGWRDPVANAAHLPGDANRRWLDHWAKARDALAAGDHESAVSAALDMIDIDRGTSAAGFYTLAECGVGADGSGDARTALEAARDASGWDTAVTRTPRISPAVLGAIRQGARSRGDLVVDSADLFRDHLGGAVPDHRMFIDYCHLTSEGIRVTMAAVASVLLDVFDAGPVTWREILPEAPRPSAVVESEASFLAAIHNAHWWQDSATVEHYIAESLRFSTHLVPIMTAFVEQQAQRIPHLLSRPATAIFQSGSAPIQQYVFGREHQCLDPLVSAAIVKGLSEIGVESVPRLDALWREQHCPEDRPIDLLDYYYLSATRQAYEVEWVLPGVPAPERDYYKAFSPVSKFCFAGTADRPAVLDITWRIPHAAEVEEKVAVRVNDSFVGVLLGGTSWSGHRITVPAGLSRDGLNELVLEWPTPAFPGDAAIQAAARDVASGSAPDLYCSFGDVHTLTVRFTGAAS